MFCFFLKKKRNTLIDSIAPVYIINIAIIVMCPVIPAKVPIKTVDDVNSEGNPALTLVDAETIFILFYWVLFYFI